MLSRTAESCFWIARYTERAEYTARLINVHYQLLLESSNQQDQNTIWRWYLESTGQLSSYEERRQPLETMVALQFLTLDAANPNALVNLIGAARENARGIQDQLSSEVWHHINRMHLAWRTYTPGIIAATPHRLLTEVQDTCYTLHGIMASTMLHDEGWTFYRLGKDIERANHTARLLVHPILLQMSHEPTELSDLHQCVAVLKSASAYEAYRKVSRSVVLPEKIVEFLLLNQYFPRSVRFCARGLRQHIERLMDKSSRVVDREPARLIGQMAADLDFATLEEIHEIGLESFLTEVLRQLDRITMAVSRTYFRSEDTEDVRISSPRRHLRLEHHEATVHQVKALLSARIQFTYTYEAPVMNVRTIMRVAPHQHYGNQRRLDVRWHMDPPADYRHYTDAFGNLVWQMDHARVEKEISCTVDMRVETQTGYLTDGSLGMQGTDPLDTDCTVASAEFTRLTHLVDRSEVLVRLSERLRGGGGSPGKLAEAILHHVHAALRYEPGRTHVGTTASEAMALGSGVCQDYTHVMLALCRLAGLPARYVSGLLPGEGQMHAWVEVLLPASGQKLPIWVGYDPTHQRRCDERYITVAVGRDYQDIAPTSGYYEGEANNRLDMAVSVTLESHGPMERWISSQTQGTAPTSNVDDHQQQQ
ncbi:MAG: alpha-E domain-containing protein [Nitrospira sp.]|nr:alpha-E domain-containing protein [Nitrospira sp.]MDH4242660.1 alpha-E domain-containing protein [Nitrospira sp.]MDH4355235.1 alpha-E domain-containing protein [Nitrospira sp.]MDH5318532.1 alpha-E domain-containing protein [Nitrospira sp.]